jgi:kynurenine formamidase
VAYSVKRRGTLAALALAPFAMVGARPATATTGGGIPVGYDGVDPRTAARVPLWHPLGADNPIFPGDPVFAAETFTTIEESGYLLERITSLGTHTGTHISAPGHFIEGAPLLDELDERFTLMPLVVIDVRDRVRTAGGDFELHVADLRAWERRNGPIPVGGAVLLLTGFGEHYSATAAASAALRAARAEADGAQTDVAIGSYFDPAPGLTGDAVAWLFDRRRVLALGSDTFGPDASSDTEFSATFTALDRGGITIENVGPGLAQMRSHGDWVAVNGGRPHFSGFQMGVTGYTLP